jgi:hypothetical protein
MYKWVVGWLGGSLVGWLIFEQYLCDDDLFLVCTNFGPGVLLERYNYLFRFAEVFYSCPQAYRQAQGVLLNLLNRSAKLDTQARADKSALAASTAPAVNIVNKVTRTLLLHSFVIEL